MTSRPDCRFAPDWEQKRGPPGPFRPQGGLLQRSGWLVCSVTQVHRKASHRLLHLRTEALELSVRYEEQQAMPFAAFSAQPVLYGISLRVYQDYGDGGHVTSQRAMQVKAHTIAVAA